MGNIYRKSDLTIVDLDKAGLYYARHVTALTEENLRSKADIAKELAVRDREIDRLQAKIDSLMLEHCPDEMTCEQKEKWAQAQRPARCLPNEV